MGKPPAFQFYANDFMDATRMWDAFACGLYIRLLCIQWTHGSLPDDQRRLAMGAGCELVELQRHWHLIEPKIPLCEDGTRKNARLEEVRSRQLEVSAKRSGAADARWEAHANASANAHAKTMQRKVKEKEKVEVEGGRGKERANDPDFEALWATYERHGSKGKALEYWKRLTPADREAIIAKAPAYVASTSGNDLRYRKHLDGWINPDERRWEAAVIQRAQSTAPVELTLREAIAECERIRAANGIAPGAYLPSHLIPAHVSKAMHRG